MGLWGPVSCVARGRLLASRFFLCRDSIGRCFGLIYYMFPHIRRAGAAETQLGPHAAAPPAPPRRGWERDDPNATGLAAPPRLHHRAGYANAPAALRRGRRLASAPPPTVVTPRALPLFLSIVVIAIGLATSRSSRQRRRRTGGRGAAAPLTRRRCPPPLPSPPPLPAPRLHPGVTPSLLSSRRLCGPSRRAVTTHYLSSTATQGGGLVRAAFTEPARPRATHGAPRNLLPVTTCSPLSPVLPSSHLCRRTPIFQAACSGSAARGTACTAGPPPPPLRHVPVSALTLFTLLGCLVALPLHASQPSPPNVPASFAGARARSAPPAAEQGPRLFCRGTVNLAGAA